MATSNAALIKCYKLAYSNLYLDSQINNNYHNSWFVYDIIMQQNKK